MAPSPCEGFHLVLAAVVTEHFYGALDALGLRVCDLPAWCVKRLIEQHELAEVSAPLDLIAAAATHGIAVPPSII